MKKKGFTLIELMITIAIIGLLAAIALPRFTNVTEDAKVANVQGNLAGLRTASEMFMVKNETRKFSDMFKIGSDELNEEFQEFYSKGKIPPIKPGKNLDHEKVGITYGRFQEFKDVNDSTNGNGEESYWGKYAFYVYVEPVTSEKKDKDDDGVAYYNYINLYALLDDDTYGADIDWANY